MNKAITEDQHENLVYNYTCQLEEMGFDESLFAKWINEWALNEQYNANDIIEYYAEILITEDTSKDYEWYKVSAKACTLLHGVAMRMLQDYVNDLNYSIYERLK